MYGIAIFISITLILLLFVVGGIVGWIAAFYLNNEEKPAPFIHPEFMDSFGNILPDEILALRFTPKLDIEEDYYDTDNNEEAEDYDETN
jgi:heme/copper-type cytochrome/quinol oxidase subunit 2